MKIAILGGGVGAMTAAYWLTNPLPDGTVRDHDITVYQLGWRLGGKGASGRNAAAGQRIEEHGLHIWMGFYVNAFRMMRAVYGELNRPPGAPLATWKDAFKPQTVYTMAEQGPDGQWLGNEWIVTTPLNPGEPGDQTGFPTPCGYMPSVVHWVAERVHKFLDGHSHDGCTPHALPEAHVAHLNVLHTALREASAHAGTPHEGGKPAPKPATEHHPILKLALEGVQKLVHIGLDLSDSCIGLRRLLMYADLGIATALGILRDLCDTDDWTAIDDEEWQRWMVKNGLHKGTVWCSAIRAMYDIVFAYHNGDAKPEKADLAAGTTTCALMRIMFDYYAGVFMKMQAGMGDTIFAPIYQVLKKRGVKFKFFHRLRDVVPSADGKTIDELHIGIQATLTKEAGDEYQPLVDVVDLPCWPSAPLYDQLEQGADLQAKGIDFESYASPDVDSRVLKRGTDFDHVVFGLSLGAVPRVCSKLMQQKESWRQMVEKVEVVRTQAFQLWLSRNIADLGWPPALDGRCYGERAVFGTFVEPLDTWADMSQLIPREDWIVPVKNVAYFCGVMPDSERGGSDAVRVSARQYLDRDIGSVWSTAMRDGKFRYDWLCVNEKGSFTDDERFERQYFRANTEPTELYVLSVTGSTKYRLDPADNGYENLSLAGDWVRNGFAIGCVEAGVLGAMKGVRRLCPGMVIVE